MPDLTTIHWIIPLFAAFFLWLYAASGLALRLLSEDATEGHKRPTQWPLPAELLVFFITTVLIGTAWYQHSQEFKRADEMEASIKALGKDYDWALTTYLSCVGGSVNCAASTLTLARENHRDVDQVKDALLKWSEFTGRSFGIDAP